MGGGRPAMGKGTDRRAAERPVRAPPPGVRPPAVGPGPTWVGQTGPVWAVPPPPSRPRSPLCAPPHAGPAAPPPRPPLARATSRRPATAPPPPSPRAPARPALASPRGAPHAAGGSETLGFFLAHLSRRLGARGGGGGGRVLDKSQLAGLQNPSRRPPPPPPSHPPRLAPSGKRRWWPRRRRALVPSKGLLPRKPWACWVVERASVRTAAGAVGMGCPFFLLLLYAVVVREAGPAHLRMMQRLSASAGD